MAETWLSQEAYDRLKEELDQLKTSGREDMAAQIEEARAHGDLKENAEYHAAKDEQGRMEARIRQLDELLRTARIGEPDDTEEVRPGQVVELEIEGDVEVYFLGSREDQHEELEILSAESPMGRAVTGARRGDSVRFATPAGGDVEVTVRDIRIPG